MATTEKPTAEIARPLEEPPYPAVGYAWYVVGVLTLIYIFSYVDRQILSLLVRPIRRDLNITDTQMSLLMGFSFALFYAGFSMPLGRLADVRSRRTIIALGLLVWSLLTAACGLAKTFEQMFVLRMGVGIGEAALAPAAYSIIADYFQPNRRGTAMGIYSMGIYLGSGLAFILGGTVAGMAASEHSITLPVVGDVHSWQIVFFMVGLPGILLTGLVYTIREPERRGAGAKRGGIAYEPMSAVLAYFKSQWKTVVCHNLGFALLSFSSYAGSAWIPIYFIRIHGWDERQAGQYYGLLVSVFSTFGVVFGGWATDWLAKRGHSDSAMRVGLWVAVLWFPTGIAYLLAPTAGWAVALLIPTLFLASAPFSAAAASIQQVVPSAMRGQASALYILVINLIGLGVGPTAVALFTDKVFADDYKVNYSILIVTSVAHVVSAIILWIGLRHFRASVASLPAWKSKSQG